MKSWRVISLLNKSRLHANQKVAYVNRAISRFELTLNEAQLISLELKYVDAATIAKQYSIPLQVSNMKGISKDEFLQVSKLIKVTYHDVFKCFDISKDRVQLLKKMNMKVDILFLLGQLKKTEDMFFYKEVLNRKPSKEEIAEFCELTRAGIKVYEKSCREFGYDPNFEDAVKTLSPFINPVRVYFDCLSSGIEVELQYLLSRNVPVGILVRHMWNTADPNLYNQQLNAYVYGYKILDFIYAKRCIRRIQKFFRYCIRKKAAIKIQRRWRKSVTDPTFLLTRLRLLREFDDLLFV